MSKNRLAEHCSSFLALLTNFVNFNKKSRNAAAPGSLRHRNRFSSSIKHHREEEERPNESGGEKKDPQDRFLLHLPTPSIDLPR